MGLPAQDSAPKSGQIHPTPDEGGIFYAGPEVTAPKLVRTVFVPYPGDIESKRIQGMTVLAMVIDAKGIPEHVQVLRSHGDAFDQASISAIQHSTFDPGTMGGKPVPVWIDVRVVFRANLNPAIPQVLITERDLAPPEESLLEDKHHHPLSYTPPFPIHTVDADFTDPFSLHPWVQVAIVEVLVSEDGLPKDVHVRRGLGFGLDEKAAAAVWHYRFLPATSKGKAVAARRNVMVDFAKF
jgi:TonB family protein